jgi:hypothetical protein
VAGLVQRRSKSDGVLAQPTGFAVRRTHYSDTQKAGARTGRWRNGIRLDADVTA